MSRPSVHRLIDLSVVLLLAPIVVPLCLLLILLIRVESPGGGLFVQTRVGRRQAPFQLYKLRTMLADTGDRPSHEVSISSVTRMGRFLRASKLDELPQLWNVLKGEMTIVGPRPCLPTQSHLIDERARRGLFAFLPGITGPAQVRNIDMATPELMAEVEADYFAASSLVSDLKIIAATLSGAGRGDVVGRS